MDIFAQIATRIIKQQALIIGPLAWNEARKVQGLTATDTTGEVLLAGTDKKQIIDTLVSRFDRLFGRASHEVSREAVVGLLADLQPTDIPQSLKG